MSSQNWQYFTPHPLLFIFLLGKICIFWHSLWTAPYSTEPCLRPRLILKSISSVTNKQNLFTGCSLSESLILALIKPQYDKRLSVELPVQFVLCATNSFEFHNKKYNWSKTIKCRIIINVNLKFDVQSIICYILA